MFGSFSLLTAFCLRTLFFLPLVLSGAFGGDRTCASLESSFYSTFSEMTTWGKLSGTIREGRQRSGDYVRGIVKTFDAERGIGIILGEMGRKYPVTLADAAQPQALVTGQLVHFSIRFVGIHGFATNVGIRQADPKK